jgi:hypothetical protein
MSLKTPKELIETGLIPEEIAKPILVYRRVCNGVWISFIKVKQESLALLLDFIDSQGSLVNSKGELAHPALHILRPITEASGLSYEEALSQCGELGTIVNRRLQGDAYFIIPRKNIVDAINHSLILKIVVPILDDNSLEDYLHAVVGLSNLGTLVNCPNKLDFRAFDQRTVLGEHEWFPVQQRLMGNPGPEIQSISILQVVDLIERDTLADKEKWPGIMWQLDPALNNAETSIFRVGRNSPVWGTTRRGFVPNDYKVLDHGGLVRVLDKFSENCIVSGMQRLPASSNINSTARNTLELLNSIASSDLKAILEGSIDN